MRSRIVLRWRYFKFDLLASRCKTHSVSSKLLSRAQDHVRKFGDYNVLSGHSPWIAPRISCHSIAEQKEEDEAEDVETPISLIKEKYLLHIDHSDVISSVKKCSTIDEQITKFCALVKINESDVEERVEIAKYLEGVLRPYFPDCSVNLLGSSRTGLGLKGCDVDLSLETNWDPSMQTENKTIPTVEDVDNGNFPALKLKELCPKWQLRFARRVLREHATEKCKEPIRLLKGRCPILMFPFGKKNLFCDISFSNKSAYDSTKLMLFCAQLDQRVIPLSIIVNYWAKYNNLVGSLKFKSYALSLMLLFFLQNRKPPVLPPLQEILQLGYFKSQGTMDYDIVSELRWMRKSENTESVSELLRQFFLFYLFYDFDFAICPLIGQSVCQQSLAKNLRAGENFMTSPICIQDPSQSGWNVATGVPYAWCRSFAVKALTASVQAYGEEWNSYQCDKDWGLALLFENEEKGLSTKIPYFSIDLPIANISEGTKSSLETAANCIVDIMQHELLFTCEVLSDRNSKQKYLRQQLGHNARHPSYTNKKLKATQKKHHNFAAELPDVLSNIDAIRDSSSVFCTVSGVACNTWKGRSLQGVNCISLSDFRENEHTVSLKIQQRIKNASLFKFLCEFSHHRNKESNSLKLHLTTVEEAHFPSLFILGVFLREYLSNVWQKLLK